MRRLIISVSLALTLLLPAQVLAQQPPQTLSTVQSAQGNNPSGQSLPLPPKQDFIKAKVVYISKQGKNDQGMLYQNLRLQILEGSNQGKEVDLVNGGITEITPAQKVSVGDTVVLTQFSDPNGKVNYFIADKYRLDTLWVLLFFFVIVVLVFTGKRGVGSILGLITSLAIISTFIIPKIITGDDPLTVTFIGSILILFISTYLAHGVSKQTTVALISTFASLSITVLLASIAVSFSKLAGLGDENAYSLTYGLGTQNVNIQGLLLSGIIIGTLGALNDVTTTQSATIFELFRHNNSFNFRQLFQRGLHIGREHITSLVNTLVLAYAGSSIAIFIFFKTNPQGWPLWMVLNSEVLFDEIVKTVTGTVGLILAVPIVTALAAGYVTGNIGGGKLLSNLHPHNSKD